MPQMMPFSWILYFFCWLFLFFIILVLQYFYWMSIDIKISQESKSNLMFWLW